MKRGFVLIICLSLVLTMFLLPGIIAPYEEVEETPTEGTGDILPVTSITLTGEGSKVMWVVDGYSASGFKLSWSKTENPTYPPRETDKWSYFSNPEDDSASLSAFDGEGDYYVRVCEYSGGECKLYSNEVMISLSTSEEVQKVETTSVKTTPEVTTEKTPVTAIKLEAEGNKIEWSVEGYSSSGFKVTWSKDKNPTYPTRKGDRYHYHSNPNTDSDVLEIFDGEGDYYVRVCEYLGGKCGLYSNEVKITLNKDGIYDYDKDEKEDDSTTEGEGSGEICPAVCMPMWVLKEVQCIQAPCGSICEFNECGSGCGSDGINSFDTEAECLEGPIDDDIAVEVPTINCNGCLIEGVCYPLGFRKDGMYCFDDFVFVNQSQEDAVCDNNFECESNLCLDNECVSGGLIRKVMSWLKGIFSSD